MGHNSNLKYEVQKKVCELLNESCRGDTEWDNDTLIITLDLTGGEPNKLQVQEFMNEYPNLDYRFKGYY